MTRLARRGGVTMAAAQLFRAVSQCLTMILLARLLQPGDFGRVAAVTPLTGFVLLFQDFGLYQLLVQRRTITPALVNHVFWITAAAGAGGALVLALASPFVARFFHDPALQPLTAASALLILGGSLASTPMALLNRRLMLPPWPASRRARPWPAW